MTGETVNGISITLPDFITTYYRFTKKNLICREPLKTSVFRGLP
ncbi:hypothetical protein TPE_0317 [Treponema pedis str. T A4]|uniref:Uncharacterized protein n=1 Tax=Treponema pedis str. T A4 TaxID=1291379 RepID=S5ZXW3_9SPIR|nr:hypothetical protein TPE_0317 [Treponema pedis str. T A4]